MHGALPYVAYKRMCRPRWNAYYFKSLVVSTIHSHKKQALSRPMFVFLRIREILLFSRMRELMNV